MTTEITPEIIDQMIEALNRVPPSSRPPLWVIPPDFERIRLRALSDEINKNLTTYGSAAIRVEWKNGAVVFAELDPTHPLKGLAP